MINFFRKFRQTLLAEHKISKYLLYALGEIVLVVIGILIALSINNWNDSLKDRIIENKILVEISNGLDQDLLDIKSNISAHNAGLMACKYYRDMITNKQVEPDSISYYYLRLARGYNSIQNKSGYESLKSRGLEIIQDDALRIEIIKLYEQDYSSILKLEEEDQEFQFHVNYFKEINNLISPHLVFDAEGEITSILLPLNMTESEQKKVLSYLWKINNDRTFVLKTYASLLENVLHLQSYIEKKTTHG